jgi:hypothetical protein
VSPGFETLLAASADDRRGAFLATGQRLGTAEQNVEKDFRVCWVLDVLFHDLPPGGPRLLFKGGTSLSKCYGLISRFSEDIDVTVFRDDLGEGASIAALEALSGKQRQARLDAIRSACQAYVTGPLKAQLGEILAQLLARAGLDPASGKVEVDAEDPDGQTLLIWYPAVTAAHGGYIRPAVKIESGAKSALDPNQPTKIRPYVADDVPGLDLDIAGITAVDAARTFWDKVVILHGLRRWFERRGMLRGGGLRVSRHYYDIHQLFHSDIGRAAMADLDLGADCVRHARMFFNRPDLDLATAAPGSFALRPVSGMRDKLRSDYDAMAGMIFDAVPPFDAVMHSVDELEHLLNANSQLG